MNTFVNEENKMTKYQERTFNDIKHIDKYGNEFWYARELQDVLDYREWRKFEGVITKAKKSCENSKINIEDHFATVDKMVKIRSKTKRKIKDYKLSRYACYLIIQNADPKKEIVALGQTYIALQTRRKELTEKEYSMLIEVEKRFCQKNLTNKENYSLNQVAKEAGVKNFDQFHDAGYRGLYNGETGDDIAKRKGLRYREDILDNMDLTELGANIFRISQTEALLKKQEEPDENLAAQIHYKVGKIVRKTIEDLGGTMPEEMPTPVKSLKELEKERKSSNSLNEDCDSSFYSLYDLDEQSEL